MRKRAAYTWLGFGGAALLVAGVFAFFGVDRVCWVGHTDLQVCFVVTDADTGKPVPNATLHVRAEPGGFCDDQESREFAIITDKNGYAMHLCTNCMCFGSKDIFEDTFMVHLPYWWFHVTAAGYSDTDRHT